MDIERLARSFEAAASEYERGRPRYPPQALDRLAAELRLAPDSAVLDLAAGTGKLTRDLVVRFSRVVAVDPLEGMLRELRVHAPEAEVQTGSADAIPVDDGVVDAVYVAQAFHWFAGPAALAEISRVLRPAGGLALLWNSTPWETNEGPWFDAVNEVLERSRADLTVAHRNASGVWRHAFDDQELFEPLEHASFRHEQRLAPADFLASLASRSYAATLAQADREFLLGEIEGLLDRPDAAIDGGNVVLPLTTVAYWTRRR
jgi:ubiquinone/menaquinone biosynthesis C-methylase UbiE